MHRKNEEDQSPITISSTEGSGWVTFLCKTKKNRTTLFSGEINRFLKNKENPRLGFAYHSRLSAGRRRNIEGVTNEGCEADLLDLPVLQAVLAVEVGPGHVGHGGALAVLLLPVSRVQGGALPILDAVLTNA